MRGCLDMLSSEVFIIFNTVILENGFEFDDNKKLVYIKG